jgi:hypothetical protein
MDPSNAAAGRLRMQARADVGPSLFSKYGGGAPVLVKYWRRWLFPAFTKNVLLEHPRHKCPCPSVLEWQRVSALRLFRPSGA